MASRKSKRTEAASAPQVAEAPKALSAPNVTLYIRNLDSSLRKEELKTQLYFRFQSYGYILDIVNSKAASSIKGQAWIVYNDQDAATQALTAEQGSIFFGRRMIIDYAKGKSNATALAEDPAAFYTSETARTLAKNRVTVSQAQLSTDSKRLAEDDEALLAIKKQKVEAET